MTEFCPDSRIIFRKNIARSNINRTGNFNFQRRVSCIFYAITDYGAVFMLKRNKTLAVQVDFVIALFPVTFAGKKTFFQICGQRIRCAFSTASINRKRSIVYPHFNSFCVRQIQNCFVIFCVSVGSFAVKNTFLIKKSVYISSFMKGAGFFFCVAAHTNIAVAQRKKSFVTLNISFGKFICLKNHSFWFLKTPLQGHFLF